MKCDIKNCNSKANSSYKEKEYCGAHWKKYQRYGYFFGQRYLNSHSWELFSAAKNALTLLKCDKELLDHSIVTDLQDIINRINTGEK